MSVIYLYLIFEIFRIQSLFNPCKLCIRLVNWPISLRFPLWNLKARFWILFCEWSANIKLIEENLSRKVTWQAWSYILCKNSSWEMLCQNIILFFSHGSKRSKSSYDWRNEWYNYLISKRYLFAKCLTQISANKV